MIRNPARCVTTLLAAATSIAGGACIHAPALKPAAAAQSVAGQPNAAAAEIAGVRLIAAGDAWKGRASSLDEQVTPIQVTLDNHSGRALRVSWHDFSLHGPTGASYAPIAVVRQDRASRVFGFGSLLGLAAYQPMAVYVPSTTRCSRQEKLVDAPYMAYSYPGVTPSAGAFAVGDDNPWCPRSAPSAEMLAEALPEGALHDRSRVAGFIYFGGLGREASVELAMKLVDASSGETFGQVSIPFAVSK